MEKNEKNVVLKFKDMKDNNLFLGRMIKFDLFIPSNDLIVNLNMSQEDYDSKYNEYYVRSILPIPTTISQGNDATFAIVAGYSVVLSKELPVYPELESEAVAPHPAPVEGK